MASSAVAFMWEPSVLVRNSHRRGEASSRLGDMAQKPTTLIRSLVCFPPKCGAEVSCIIWVSPARPSPTSPRSGQPTAKAGCPYRVCVVPQLASKSRLLFPPPMLRPNVTPRRQRHRASTQLYLSVDAFSGQMRLYTWSASCPVSQSVSQSSHTTPSRCSATANASLGPPGRRRSDCRAARPTEPPSRSTLCPSARRCFFAYPLLSFAHTLSFGERRGR